MSGCQSGRGERQLFVAYRNRLTAETRRRRLEQTEPVAHTGTPRQHLIVIRPAQRDKLGVGAARRTVTVLEEIGAGRESRQHPPARTIHGIKNWHIQTHRWRERINRGNICQRHRQADRPRRQRT